MKTAIVMSGGGMKCSYSWGVLSALIKKYDFKKPDIAIGASGNIGTLAYYLSGQYESIENIWVNFAPSRKLVSFLRAGKILDIDYLIDDVFRRKEPLDVDKVINSGVDYRMTATNYATGKIEHFKNLEKHEFWDAMRASKAVPVAYNKKIEFRGQKYCDTPAGASASPHFKEARRLGAEKIIVIDTVTLGSLFFSAWLAFQTKIFKKNYLDEVKNILSFTYPEDENIVVIRPQKKLLISTLTNSKKLIKKTIEQGFEETVNDKRLEKFFENV